MLSAIRNQKQQTPLDLCPDPNMRSQLIKSQQQQQQQNSYATVGSAPASQPPTDSLAALSIGSRNQQSLLGLNIQQANLGQPATGHQAIPPQPPVPRQKLNSTANFGETRTSLEDECMVGCYTITFTGFTI